MFTMGCSITDDGLLQHRAMMAGVASMCSNGAAYEQNDASRSEVSLLIGAVSDIQAQNCHRPASFSDLLMLETFNCNDR